MRTRFILGALALAAASAAFGNAQAATSMDVVHERVALARAAEERHRIASELHRGRLDPATAGTLRAWTAHVAAGQRTLSRRGGETVDEALAINHEQDLLDWAIRTGHAEFEPAHALAGA